MKSMLLQLVFCTIMLTSSSCQKEDDSCSPTQQACDPQRKKVRDVANEKGVVWFNQVEQRYAIHSNTPGTVDNQIIGFVCGDLPTSLRQDGLKVVFSGTYRESNKQSPIGGLTYYYLEVSEIELEK